MRIKLAPMRREKPAAIEKNAAEEEMSRMVVGGLRTQYRTNRTSRKNCHFSLQDWPGL